MSTIQSLPSFIMSSAVMIACCAHLFGLNPVSYTHLDVYKRQDVYTAYFDTYRHLKADLPDYNVVKANEFKTDYPGVAVKNLFPLVAEERMQKDVYKRQDLWY